MSVTILRGDARQLPLPDACVDLIVTSPPYWQLRSYSDDGEHYSGQIGSEPTVQEYLDNLLDCTREWMRVLKPTGNLFINIGDKYANDTKWDGPDRSPHISKHVKTEVMRKKQRTGLPPKSLIGLPWRYAIGCIDELGLILRAEIIWSKVNGLPESVTDRVRRSHEQVFHFTKQQKYFSAVDEIREPQQQAWRSTGRMENRGTKYVDGNANQGFGLSGETPREYNPLGKLPGSVWSIPTSPLKVPSWVGIDHFAAYPPELCRRIILGWSPKEGTCLDPFGGTGTTAMTADVLGRNAISVDMSADYCKLASWRTHDPVERAKVLKERLSRSQLPARDQPSLFEEMQ